MADYARAFRILRAARNLTQAEVAELVGLSSSQISLIEAGKRNPGLVTLAALSKELGLPRILVELLAAEPEELQSVDVLEPLTVTLFKNLIRGAKSGGGGSAKGQKGGNCE
jgi:transcriptional regulator with XRE-family HTH domain